MILSRIGEITYNVILLSLKSCLTGKDNYSKISSLSATIDSMVEKAENKAFELIARFQPVASDLRLIKSYMKTSNDFSRYGRYALDISYISRWLGSLDKCEVWISTLIENMSDKVLSMVQISRGALKDHNVELARSISSIEKEVDKMYFEFLDKLVEAASTTNRCTIASVLVVRYLERIADHAVDICESLVYVVTGEQVSLD